MTKRERTRRENAIDDLECAAYDADDTGEKIRKALRVLRDGEEPVASNPPVAVHNLLRSKGLIPDVPFAQADALWRYELTEAIRQ